MVKKGFGDHKKHTYLKLRVLEEYCASYTRALKGQKFTLIYIDAFAGKGFHTERSSSKEISGSTTRILNSETINFHEYIFIEKEKKNAELLRELVSNHPQSSVNVHCGDANETLPTILKEYTQRKSKRFLVFFDPFGLNVEMSTLQNILSVADANIDLLILLNIQGIRRLIPRRKEVLRPEWEDVLQKLFGEIKLEEFYTTQPDLFGDKTSSRHAISADQISGLYQKQLLQLTKVTYVEETTKPSNHHNEFALIFAMNNPSENAKALGKKLIGGIKRAVRQIVVENY